MYKYCKQWSAESIAGGVDIKSVESINPRGEASVGRRDETYNEYLIKQVVSTAINVPNYLHISLTSTGIGTINR